MVIINLLEILIFCIAVYFVLEYKDKYKKEIRRELRHIKRMEDIDDLISRHSKKK